MPGKGKPDDHTKEDRRKAAEAEAVQLYMEQLDHPLKEEIGLLRSIIQTAGPGIHERIKWNAPSYYFTEDMVTFNPRDQSRVHLVFHHPAIVSVTSPLLEGDYKDRRMMYFRDAREIRASKKELQRVIRELMQRMNE